MTAHQPTDVEILYRKAQDLIPALRERANETAALGKLLDDYITKVGGDVSIQTD